MSDVEVYSGEPLTEMGLWARDANEIAQMAAKLVQTSFVPASYNGKPAEATAAILTGLEVGLKPMAALRSIVVINGTPALTAQALRGLVQAAGHKIWVEESTSQRAVVKGIRKGDDQVQTSTWDVARASALGLMNKPNYKNQAQSMFVARATAEMARLIGSDAVMGLAYSIEELTDEGPVEEVPGKAPAKRTVRRAALPRPEIDEPELPAADEAAAPAEQVAERDESAIADAAAAAFKDEPWEPEVDS